MSSHSADASTGAQKSQEETAKGDLNHASENHIEQQHENKDTKQDDGQGGNDPVDCIIHPAFVKARMAIPLFVCRSEKVYQESQDEYFMQTWSMVEGDLDKVDDMHKKALTIVRKAIEVDKKEGDKLKADLRQKWQAQRCPFANRLPPFEYDESDSDLNPHSDLEEEYSDE
ncbi:hypothetical protein BJ166DRAFT_246818 [Pestalotiopsis sp. NC0098]|nr:hypothetical protein BJ166DRAFT_246818 [Pestalotiopsis sp. NC0098]